MPAIDSQGGKLQADLDLLKEVGAEAGRIAIGYFRKDPEVWMKTGQSPVSEADFAVDRYLRDTLLGARPDYGWLSEETTDTADRLQRRRTFVVDPIDGTRGFLEGRKTWCVSIAIVETGRPLVGVLDCPAHGEVYWASLGGGAFRNGVRLVVRPIGDAPEIGGPKPMIDALPQPLRENVRRIAYVPSLAYRIAMIAGGTLDATFVRPNAQDWDLAAADLILAEAGGQLRNRHRAAPRYGGVETTHGALAAGSSSGMLDFMSDIIAGYET